MRCDVNHTQIGFVLPREQFVWNLLMPAAIEVKANAQRIAPVHKEYRKDRKPGTYRASFFRRQARSVAGIKTYEVGTSDRIGNLVEWGAHKGKQKGKHILLVAAGAAGLKVEGG